MVKRVPFCGFNVGGLNVRSSFSVCMLYQYSCPNELCLSFSDRCDGHADCGCPGGLDDEQGCFDTYDYGMIWSFFPQHLRLTRKKYLCVMITRGLTSGHRKTLNCVFFGLFFDIVLDSFHTFDADP